DRHRHLPPTAAPAPPLLIRLPRRSLGRTAGPLPFSYPLNYYHANQSTLLRFDEPEEYSVEFFRLFHGKTVPYSVLQDYALNETVFTTPNGILKEMENKRLIARVHRFDGVKRRQGSFQEGDLIEFSKTEPLAQQGFSLDL
ncbi:MAG: hypothetical protein H0T73_03870, partial [Ardenticatenales bacterium]|nr:hypothetical protein [Ardenticatenales bacterium]